MKYFHPVLKKIPILILLGAFGISSMLVAARPQSAEAQIPVTDVLNSGENITSYIEQGIQYTSQLSTQASTYGTYLKGYVGDPLAWAVAKATLRSTTNDLIHTVSTGRHTQAGRSGPMFVTNLSKNLKNNVNTPLEEKTIGGITSNAKKTKAPFLSKAAGEVRNNFFRGTSDKGYYSTHKSTLSKTVKNPKKFVEGDFSQGGVNGLLSMSSKPANNPYGSYYSIKNYLQSKTTRADSSRTAELKMGGGFLSSKGMPGSVIKAQLNKDLGSGVSSLVSAHTIGEVISGLAANLANHIIGSNGGLTGFSKSPASSKYVNTSPPIGGEVAKTLISKINSSEKTLASYSAEWGTIANSAQNASSTLTALIDYSPPTTGSSTQQYTTCLSEYNTMETAATAAFAKVQTIITNGQIAVSGAKTAKQKFETVRTEITAAVKANSTADLQKASTALQSLINPDGGIMPSPSNITYAKTQSTPISTPGNTGIVISSGLNKLVVTGGTIVDRMPVLAKNAAAALAKIKACFESAGSFGGTSG